MITLKYLLVVLHALTAVAFFGLGLPLVRLAKAALGHTGEARAALLAHGSQSVRGMTGAGILTTVLAFATLAVGMQTGMRYGWPYHAASALVFVLLGVHVFGTARAWARLSQNGGEADFGKVSAFVGMSHLLWLVLFFLMFAKYFGLTA